jgi:hypothetical protein
VPIQADQPRVIRRRQAELGDRPLEANLIRIHELNRYRFFSGDRVNDLGANPIVWVTQSSLPHADVTGWHVQIPRLEAEFLWWEVGRVAQR